MKYHMVTIADLVPQEHFLRKVEAELDRFLRMKKRRIYNSREYGQPSIDPVVMIKYLLVGFLYGIPLERQVEERCADSNAFCWYLGIDLDKRVPDHSTIVEAVEKR